LVIDFSISLHIPLCYFKGLRLPGGFADDGFCFYFGPGGVYDRGSLAGGNKNMVG